MKPANYSLIKYIGDPIRNEPVNIGVLVWDDHEVCLRLNEAATRRVIRENPHLDRDALLYVDEYLRAEILEPWSADQWTVHQILSTFSGAPVTMSEPRFTSIDDRIPEGFDRTVDRLLARLVHPRRRQPEEPREPGTEAYFRKRFHSLIQQKLVTEDYPFPASQSGVLRTVSYYANSGRDVVLDIVPLGISDERTLQQRIDAEAGKIHDIREKNLIRYYFVYCQIRNDDSFDEAAERAKMVIESTGAQVMIDREEAAQAFETRAADV